MNIKNKITNSLNNIKQWLVREQELVSASVPLRVPPELNIFSRDILKLQIDMIMSEDRDFHWLQTDYILNSYGDMVFPCPLTIFIVPEFLPKSKHLFVSSPDFMNFFRKYASSW